MRHALIVNYENYFIIIDCYSVQNDADYAVDDENNNGDHSLSIDGNLIFIQ